MSLTTAGVGQVKSNRVNLQIIPQILVFRMTDLSRLSRLSGHMALSSRNRCNSQGKFSRWCLHGTKNLKKKSGGPNGSTGLGSASGTVWLQSIAYFQGRQKENSSLVCTHPWLFYNCLQRFKTQQIPKSMTIQNMPS
jgi:hypothetical protein